MEELFIRFIQDTSSVVFVWIIKYLTLDYSAKKYAVPRWSRNKNTLEKMTHEY